MTSSLLLLQLFAMLAVVTHGFQPFTTTTLSRKTPSHLLLASKNKNNNNNDDDDDSNFAVGILGDLHIDPRKLDDYIEGRQQWRQVLAQEKARTNNLALVSLGDLGESKYCDHNLAQTDELFSGTSLCHEIAASYLGSFGVPYEVIGGNHDLEGLDEFRTDQDNLEAFLQAHDKPTPQFCREIADQTLLVGLGSTVFRDAPYTSHEVIIDDQQIEWFETLLQNHPAHEGWKVFVFTHAPPNGSGLRVLQENHVVNGCCWLNHSDESKCRKFIELCRQHHCIKAWFSGHFHLGQDYQDSITFPYSADANRGSCVFGQTSVMRQGTSRDGRRQSRLLRGSSRGFEVCTVDHAQGGQVRVDATITYDNHGGGVYCYSHDDISASTNQDYFKVYTPQVGDEGHIRGVADQDLSLFDEVEEDSRAWWRLSSGRVLGMHQGMLLEYDRSTLAPLGLVVSKDELLGKKIAVVEVTTAGETTAAEPNDNNDTVAERDQAVLMYDNTGSVTVIQPNEDGSYWRKIVRNKVARMAERRREKAAAQFAQTILDLSEKEAEEQVMSSWGPYTTTSGTAKTTQIVPEGLVTDCAPSPCEPTISRATVVQQLLFEGDPSDDESETDIRPLLDLKP